MFKMAVALLTVTGQKTQHLLLFCQTVQSIQNQLGEVMDQC